MADPDVVDGPHFDGPPPPLPVRESPWAARFAALLADVAHAGEWAWWHGKPDAARKHHRARSDSDRFELMVRTVEGRPRIYVRVRRDPEEARAALRDLGDDLHRRGAARAEEARAATPPPAPRTPPPRRPSAAPSPAPLAVTAEAVADTVAAQEAAAEAARAEALDRGDHAAARAAAVAVTGPQPCPADGCRRRLMPERLAAHVQSKHPELIDS